MFEITWVLLFCSFQLAENVLLITVLLSHTSWKVSKYGTELTPNLDTIYTVSVNLNALEQSDWLLDCCFTEISLFIQIDSTGKDKNPLSNFRGSHLRCSIEKAVLKNFAVFQKVTLTQVFSCEYCEIFKNTYFKEHLRTAASRTCQFCQVLFAVHQQIFYQKVIITREY